MLVPSAFLKLPSTSGCFNDQTVMGGTVTQFAAGLAQLSHCKFLGQAHYQVSHTTEGQTASSNGTGTRLYQDGVVSVSYKTKEYHFLYQSTALSENLVLIIKFAASQIQSTPEITVTLRDTTANSFTGTILDHGIRFIELSASSQDSAAESSVFTGATLTTPPTNSTATTLIRPLYVPLANRGQLLNVSITVNDVALSGMHIYDIYQVEVTP